MVARPTLGLLGQMTRAARVPIAALAAGAACGLLSGQGWQEIVTAPPWHLWGIGGTDAVFAHGISAAELVEVILPLAVLAWLATVQRLWRAWPILLIATVVPATLNAPFWHLLRTAANQFG
jgi:hypothetical protein